MSFADDVHDREQRAPSADPLDLWPAFERAVRARLEQGRAAYGDASFARPLPALADEIAQELLDTAGWAFVAFVRIEHLRAKLAELDPASDARMAGAPPDGAPAPIDLGTFEPATLALLERLCRALGKPPGVVITMALATLVAELERAAPRDNGSERMCGAARGRLGTESGR